MFTGLIEEIGKITQVRRTPDDMQLTIAADAVLRDVAFGESICVDGVCLSVTDFSAHEFTVGLAHETRRLTTLGAADVSHPVNLERAMLPTRRMGGHYVQGHVDGMGHIADIRPDGDALMITIRIPAALARYIVRKGYITVDGISLTVVDVGTDWFSLTLISHSQALVTLSGKSVGDEVNLEVDIMAKYAEKILEAHR